MQQDSMVEQPEMMVGASLGGIRHALSILTAPEMLRDIFTSTLVLVLATVGYFCTLHVRRQSNGVTQKCDPAADPDDVMQKVKRARGGTLGSRRSSWKQEVVAFTQLVPLMFQNGCLCIARFLRLTQRTSVRQEVEAVKPKEPEKFDMFDPIVKKPKDLEKKDAKPKESENKPSRKKKQSQEAPPPAPKAPAGGGKTLRPQEVSPPTVTTRGRGAKTVQTSPKVQAKEEVVKTKRIQEAPAATEDEIVTEKEVLVPTTISTISGDHLFVMVDKGGRAKKQRAQDLQQETTKKVVLAQQQAEGEEEAGKVACKISDDAEPSTREVPRQNVAGEVSEVRQEVPDVRCASSRLEKDVVEVKVQLKNGPAESLFSGPDCSESDETMEPACREASTQNSTDGASEIGQEQAPMVNDILPELPGADEAVRRRVMKEFEAKRRTFDSCTAAATVETDATSSGGPAACPDYSLGNQQYEQQLDPARFMYADPAGYCMGDFRTADTYDERSAWPQPDLEAFQQWAMTSMDENSVDYSFGFAQGSDCMSEAGDYHQHAWPQELLNDYVSYYEQHLHSEWMQEIGASGQEQEVVVPVEASTADKGDEPPPPEVVAGAKEREYVGLQLIAEMGEWCVLKEESEEQGGRPFFWNDFTGQRTWKMPELLADTGIGALLVKYAEKLKPPSYDLPDHERQQRAMRLSAGLEVKTNQEIMHQRAMYLAKKFASQQLQEWSGGDGQSPPQRRRRRAGAQNDDAQLRSRPRRRGGKSVFVEESASMPLPAVEFTFAEEAFPALG